MENSQNLNEIIATLHAQLAAANEANEAERQRCAALNADLLSEQLRWTNTRIDLIKLSNANLNMVDELVIIAKGLPTSENISLFGVIDRMRRAAQAVNAAAEGG